MAKAKKAKSSKSAKGSRPPGSRPPGSRPPAKKKAARPAKAKKQREPYSILIPFLVVLLVLVGIFDLTLAFYIWLNRDKGKSNVQNVNVSMGASASYAEAYETPRWRGDDFLAL